MLSEKVGQDAQNYKYTYYVYDTSQINLIKKAQTLYSNYADPYSSSNEANFAVTNYTYSSSEAGCTAKGLLKTVTDPEGHTITYTYDTDGNIKKETNPQTNKDTTYTYNGVGWKTSVLTAKGYTTSYDYDLNGNVEKETLQGGEVTRTTYDDMGRKTKVVSPNLYDSSLDEIANHTYRGDSGYRYTYYPSGKVETQTDSKGNQTSYTYDLYGNVKTETKPNLSVYEYYYDVLNRLTDVKFKDTESAEPVLLVSYSYLILVYGKTQKTETKYLNDSETAVTVYTYDYLNRLIEQVNPDKNNKQIVFDYDGTVKTTTDESGNITYFHYDGLSRNTEQWIPLSNIDNSPLYTYKAYVYDKAGNIIQEKTCKTVMTAEQVPSTTITKEYYSDNKLKSQIDSSGRKTEYQYDDDRYLNNKDVYTASTAKNTTEYVNNYFGKPISEKIHVREGDLDGNDFASTQDAILCIGYSYDKNGNIKSKSNPTAWYTKTSMPTARNYLGTAAANGKIYAIGGNSNGTYSNIIEEYNPVTNTWATKNNTNFTARDKLGIVSLDGKIYAIGGYNGSYLGTVQMYDPTADTTWTNKASMSVARSQLGVVSFNGKIYAIGGYLGAYTSIVTVYDPVTNTWTQKTSMPTIRCGLGLAVVNGKIYAIGGHTSSETLNTVEEYDPVANTWIAKTAMPTARSGFGIEVVNNKIYILGGTNVNNNYFDTIEEYDPVSDSWSKTGILPNACAGLGATTVDGKIYAIGGVTYDTTTHDLQTVVANIPAPAVTTSYTYDNLNKLISTSMPGVDENNDPVTITTNTTYNWSGKVLTQTDAYNHTTTNTYDQRDRLIKVTDALGYSTAYYYDRAGRMIAEVSPNDYDSNKSLAEMSKTEYTYDLMDRVKTKSYTYLDPVSSQWVTFVAKAYKYDKNGNKIKELDALGYEAGAGSTVDDKITSGYGTEDTYDPANRLTAVLDPVSKERNLSFTAKYDYDGAGRKTAETNAQGVVTSYTYNDSGNLLTTKVNNQTTQVNTYDLVGNLLTQTDGNGNTITYEYNAWNKLKKAVYPGDATIPACNITYQYDVNGNLKKKVNSAGPVDLYTYDNQGRELSHTQQKNDGTQSITTFIRYDKAGNKRFLVDGNNVTTENTYNEVNKLTSSKITVTNINGVSHEQTTSYGYDANGNQLTKTDWLGNTSTNVYDSLGRLIEKKDPLTKSIEKLDYNHNSVQIKSTDALGKATQFTYDKNNRLLSTLDPLNHSKSQTYDEIGNVKTTIDGRSKVTTNNYDAFNRLASVVNAKNETTSYTYDLNGNRLTQTDGVNHVTTFEYNVANKLSKKIDHGGRTGTSPNYTYDSSKTESYTYDAAGNLATKQDRNGNTTTYIYDVHGRVLSQSAGTQTITYTYDGNGNPLTMTDSTGTTTRTYDQLNRTKSKIVPGVGTLTFLYDLTTGLHAGQVAETDTDPKGNATTQVFDQAGRMIKVTAGGKTTTYTYYDNGSKQRALYPDGSSEEYTYYDDGMLHTLVNKKAGQTVIDSYTYTYDAAHNQTSKVDRKGTTNYTYDELNRLKTVTEPSSEVTTYAYDAAGNRATQTKTQGTTNTVTTYTYNEQNRLMNSVTKLNNVTTQTVTYTYDNNGNQLKATKLPYVNGIPQTAQVTQCTYDKLNQLLITSIPDGTVVTNTYNGEGLRVAKQVNGQTTKYVYISDKVVLELDGSGNQVACNVQGTSLIARTVGGTTLYYMYNGHADVTALLDANGTIQATYYYDAFGNILESTGNVNNPFTYAGYQYDKETGLYLCNSRFYDPINARFLTEDTVNGNPNDPLSLNRYTYCVNNPIKYNDPTGHWPNFGGFFSGFSNFFSGLGNTFSSWGTSAINWGTSAYNSASSWVSNTYNANSSWINPTATAVAAVGSVAVGIALLPEVATAGVIAGTALGVSELAATIGGSALIGGGLNLGLTEINDFEDNGKFDTSFNQYLGSYVGGLAMGALAPIGGELSPLANAAWMGASVMSGNVVEQYVSTGSVDYTQAALAGIGGAIGGTALTYGLKAGVPLVSKALGTFDSIMSDSLLINMSGFKFGQSSLNFATDGFSFNYGNDILSGVKSDSWKMTQDSISKSMKAIQDSISKSMKAIQDSVVKIIENEGGYIRIGYKGVGEATVPKRPGGYVKNDVDMYENLSPQVNRAPGNKNIAADNRVQAHHPIQNEWAERNIPGYDKGEAPSILLESSSGKPHAKISSAQRNRRRVDGYNTDIVYEFNTSYREMIDAGVDVNSARKAIRSAYKYFDGLGGFK